MTTNGQMRDMTTDTRTVVAAMTKGLGHEEKVELAKVLRGALASIPKASGPFDAGMRDRFADVAAYIESVTSPMDTERLS